MEIVLKASRIANGCRDIVSIVHSNATEILSLLLTKYGSFTLGPVGLIVLADLETVALRTALKGTASWTDALVLCPGLHKQQNAPSLSKGEFPACAAMTTGYVFRVENEATVLHLQKLGRSGHLTTLHVSSVNKQSLRLGQLFKGENFKTNMSFWSCISYSCAVAVSVLVATLLLLLQDWWGLTVLCLLVSARAVNVIVIRRRASIGWKGAQEPGVSGDLLILLSRDRWIRMRGLVDDLKAVTSGEWLRESTFVESSVVSCATLLVYFDAALATNMRREGQVLLLVMLLCSAALLGAANQSTREFRMYDKLLTVDGKPKPYWRRLDLADELIQETGRDDWAIRLGMTQPKEDNRSKSTDMGPKTM